MTNEKLPTNIDPALERIQVIIKQLGGEVTVNESDEFDPLRVQNFEPFGTYVEQINAIEAFALGISLLESKEIDGLHDIPHQYLQTRQSQEIAMNWVIEFQPTLIFLRESLKDNLTASTMREVIQLKTIMLEGIEMFVDRVNNLVKDLDL